MADQRSTRRRTVSVIASIAATLTLVPVGVVGTAHVSASAPPRRASVSSEVERQLEAARDGQMITVIVRLRQQADVHRHRPGNRQQRQTSLITEMQTVAASTQRSMRVLLAIRRGQGRVDRIEPLWLINAVSITATADVITELSQRAEVESIVPDAIDVVATALPPTPRVAAADVSLLNAPALWDLGYTGQGVVVADLDTGVDATHPDLAGTYRGGTNSWFDPYGQHATPTDLSGHGTATTGIMVAGSASGTSIGMAPGARWIAARIFNDQGKATATAIHQALQWTLDPDGNPATADSPQVVNNSWAFGTPGCHLDFQVDLQAMRVAGIIPVFAAGNYGSAAGTSVSPANYPEALAVGSTDGTDVIDPSTSVGPSACGEAATTYPDLVAPGVDIMSTDLYGGYYPGTGTSFAAPHVAGAIALLLSAQPGANATVEGALAASAVDLGPAGPDNVYGKGRIDVAAALTVLQSGGTTTTTTTTLPPTTTTTTTLPPTTTTTTTLPPTTTTTVPAVPPTASGLVLTPAATNGSTAVGITATVTADPARTVASAEWFVGTVGAPGTGQPMTGSFGGTSAAVSASITPAQLASLPEGSQTISVRGRDAAGVWSALTTSALLVDRSGPSFISLALSPATMVAGTSASIAATISGASDGSGSGAVGGEWWIGSTAPAPGSATAFTGLAPVLPVSSPAAGSYTVNVRLRDSLGNWGAPRGATLTVTAPVPPGFTDGFESGALPGAWSSRSTTSSTRLSVSTSAALVGTFGLRAQGNNTNYVQYDLAAAVPVHDARFLFRPNANKASGQVIFQAGSTRSFSTVVYRVRYRLNGSTPQVQIQLGTSTSNSTWTNLLGGTSNNVIEVVWQARGSGGPGAGTLQLVVNGVAAQTLTTTSTTKVGAVRLGSVSNGSSNVLEYFDAFASKSTATPLIGA